MLLVRFATIAAYHGKVQFTFHSRLIIFMLPTTLTAYSFGSLGNRTIICKTSKIKEHFYNKNYHSINIFVK